MKIQQMWEYPPEPFLNQVHKNCPQAAATYCQLWKARDKANRVAMSKRDIAKYRHYNAFKRDLQRLFDECLISYDDEGQDVLVELVDWEEMEE